AQKLIENLERIDKENQYFVFLLKENFDEFQPRNKNFKKVLADYRWYTFSEQINMPKLLNKYDLDIVHFPHFNVPILYRRKFIITIHDLILLHFPTLKGTKLNPIFYWIKFLAYKLAIGSAVRRSKKIITVSKFSKKDILANYPFLTKDKVAVTYEACDLKNKIKVSAKGNEEILKKYGIIKPYLVYVGNAYPHKNLDRLVDSWKIFLNKSKDEKDFAQSPYLVLVGKKDYFYSKLAKRISADKMENVILTGFVPDNELDLVYEKATAYIFPSLYEGFGLPPLEAMERGLPVATNAHGCMREILGKSAYYFDGKKIDSIIEAIRKMFLDASLKNELINRGYKQVLKYDWKKMARETLDIYEKI
ncbi:MAG: glycosyl transferase, group 1, partial [Candidatus Moranbacteria bacterium GW2011_GWE2_35_164]